MKRARRKEHRPVLTFWSAGPAHTADRMEAFTAGKPGAFVPAIVFGQVLVFEYSRPSDISDSFLEDGRDAYGYWMRGKRCGYSNARIERARIKAERAAYSADR